MSDELRQVTRADIVREARACIGVPFRHQHSNPEAGGLDCRGLLEWVAHSAFGRPLPPPHTYQRKPSGVEFYARLKAEMEEIATNEAREGDVVMIQLPRHDEPRHAGILVEGRFEMMIIHAWEADAPGRVICEPYRGWLVRRTRHAFHFPGVID
jgi:cell wall-associated NlpC family hydrolase